MALVGLGTSDAGLLMLGFLASLVTYKFISLLLPYISSVSHLFVPFALTHKIAISLFNQLLGLWAFLLIKPHRKHGMFNFLESESDLFYWIQWFVVQSFSYRWQNFIILYSLRMFIDIYATFLFESKRCYIIYMYVRVYVHRCKAHIIQLFILLIGVSLDSIAWLLWMKLTTVMDRAWWEDKIFS